MVALGHSEYSLFAYVSSIPIMPIADAETKRFREHNENNLVNNENFRSKIEIENGQEVQKGKPSQGK
jgi:hypothetical protein